MVTAAPHHCAPRHYTGRVSTLSEITVIDFPGFPTVVVHSPGQAMGTLPQFMDTAFRALGAAVQALAQLGQGAAAAGHFAGVLVDGADQLDQILASSEGEPAGRAH